MKTISVLSVDGRPKRIKKYADSDVNVLVWTGQLQLQLYASVKTATTAVRKYQDFNTKLEVYLSQSNSRQ